MEPHEPAKNDESSGSFKRRISSILKMPQKSTSVCESEQQEYTVESAKPVEKRKSRRVSFAPANDVLLFSKDVKSTSPVRSPLQDLMTATAATTNRIRVPVTEDEIQPIMGMDTLLNAPLHISQQRERVNFDMRDNYGEKTMFFTDDISLDMTQSHTINIASNVDALTSSRERTQMKTGGSEFMDANRMASGSESQPGGRNMGLSREKENQSSSVPCLDQEFQTLLASISKSSGPPQTQMKTQMDDMDKENKVCFPKFASVVDKPSMPRRTGEPFYGSALFPEAGVSRDVPEVLKGCVQGSSADDYDFFQCLFPTHGMFSQSEKKISQTLEMKSKQQQSSKALCSSDPKDMTSMKNSVLHVSQKHKTFEAGDDWRERTIRFSAMDAAMDVTQVHPVNIDTAFNPEKQLNMNPSPAGGERTVRFSAMDAAMDVTQVHPVNIDTAFNPQKQLNMNPSPAGGERTVRFSAIDAAMDVTQVHPVNIETAFNPQKELNMNPSPAGGERTVRFSTMDAAMDVTQVHPVNIDTAFNPEKQLNMNPSPAGGERTVRFSTMDAAMDVTQVHPVNIETAFNPQKQLNMNPSPAGGERTVRFSATDAAMDVTQVHPVNIETAFNPQKQLNMNPSPAGGERTVRFSAKDAAMDVTQVHPVNIETAFNPEKQLNMNPSPAGGERTVRFSATDAAMDVTQVHPVNIETAFNPEKQLNMNPSPAGGERTVRFSTMDAAMDVTQVHPVNIEPAFNPEKQLNMNPSPAGGERTVRFSTMDAAMDVTQVHPVNIETAFNPEKQLNMNPSPAGGERTVRFSTMDAAMDVTQVHPVNIDTAFNPQKQLNMNPSPAGGEGTVRFSATDAAMDITLDTVNISAVFDPQTHQNVYLLPSAAALVPEAHQNVDTLASSVDSTDSMMNVTEAEQKHMINESPDTFVDSCTVPLPQVEYEEGKNSTDKTTSLPVVKPEMDVVDVEDRTQAQCHKEGEVASATVTPFNLKTKQLMSRLSIGGFKPKLPQRSKPHDPKKAGSSGEHTKTITVNVTSHLSKFDHDVSNIFDEELGSYDDMSETLDTSSLQKICEKACNPQELNMDQPVEDWGLEVDLISDAHVEKRPLPEDENDMGCEKRVKTSPEEAQSHVSKHYDHITTAPTVTIQTTDFSNSSHTASIRCEATFESTFKHSIFESQLEDYANNVQKKFDDGTITVSEFFKLFNIDFVIHNPRQSVFPSTDLLNADRTPLDLLKDRHINRPKQRVYETDVFNLTEKVERMNMRTRDLDKPLRLVNRSLWEEMRGLSEEELKLFGAKLKERNNHFRKLSKTNSHEMKEVLYSNLLQANVKEQQTLRGTIEKADEMIKSLDDCIQGLEAELAEVEKGSGCRPGLKFYQEELKKVTEALTESERQVSELEMQKKQSSDDLNRLKTETTNLQDSIIMLHMVNEWKLGKKRDNCTIYTFLYDTIHLHVVYEKSNGQTADNEPEKKILDITFKFLLDDAEAEFNARLVHKLLSQYIEEESAWVTKYPTRRHVPQLLHDVSLVVGRCRLLGEELRLLQMWGSLKLDVLDINSVDTQVFITFSSLRRFAKFEVVFSVSLINQLYELQLQSFTNTIGSTTKQQVEEIVASFSPGKKLLTKVVKKIHETLLC